ncbi:MAG: efflux RND transporter periplasmic adaptor subunit [Lachnospiraceae bacterium]|nr:efflux RND transporter periplasmic adaptor subunit [Lachnospiraceae bacterium]
MKKYQRSGIEKNGMIKEAAQCAGSGKYRKKGLKRSAVLVPVLLLLALTSCKKEEEEPLSPSISDTVITITEQFPEVRTLSTESNYIGTVEADSTVYIIPKVSAEVLTKNFEVGDHVEAGDLLFTLDDSTARIALDQANASLKSAEAGLSAAQANYEAGQANYAALEASNTAAHIAAVETMGKLDTTSQQMQLAADSAYTQALQAGLSSDSAHQTYEFYGQQIEDAEDSRNDLKKTRDNAQNALAKAREQMNSAASLVANLQQAQASGVIPAGYSDETAVNAALTAAKENLTAAQSAVATYSNAVASAESAIASLDSTIDQLYFQQSTSLNTADSASLAYQLACESADLARRQQSDYDTYTRQTITAQTLASVIGSDQQLAATGAQIRASGAQVEATSAGVDQAGAAVANAKTALSYYSVTSPVSGTITAIGITEHNMATSAQTAYTIKGDAPCKITFYVAEKTAKEMEPGLEVTLEKDGQEFKGTIVTVSSEIDPSRGLYRIETQAVDPLLSLPYDSNVKLRAASRRSENVLTVPADSVYYEGEQAFVYINDHGTARRKDVTIGLTEGDAVEIREGIGKNDYIITSWSARLKDGMRVIAEHNTGKKDDIVVVINQ